MNSNGDSNNTGDILVIIGLVPITINLFFADPISWRGDFGKILIEGLRSGLNPELRVALRPISINNLFPTTTGYRFLYDYLVPLGRTSY